MQILDRATELQHLLFIQDVDFLIETAYRQRENLSWFGVIYAHQLQVSIGQCVQELELISSALELGEVENLLIYLSL
jgi:hypothetical protein